MMFSYFPLEGINTPPSRLQNAGIYFHMLLKQFTEARTHNKYSRFVYIYIGLAYEETTHVAHLQQHTEKTTLRKTCIIRPVGGGERDNRE